MDQIATQAGKPRQGFWGLWNISFGFFGIQIGFALQNANMSRIFQSLGASVIIRIEPGAGWDAAVPIFWQAQCWPDWHCS
jgi:hypothetical protein